MSKGIYNVKYFANHPEECTLPGILYCVVLVNKKTSEREVMKVGIAKGKTWRDAVKRATGFKGYELKIQKVYSSTIYDCFIKEQALHAQFKHLRKSPLVKFSGHTECFEISSEILNAFPKNNP